MRVLLDSSAILRDPARSKEAVRTLERLLASGQIVLHIPEVVVREVEANSRVQAEVELEKIRSAAGSLRRRLPAHIIAAELTGIDEAIGKARTGILAALEGDFRSWLAAQGTTIDPIANQDGAAVMSAYFSGAPPFKESRHREDIPDAFILESVRRLASSGPLGVVIADERLAQAAATVPGVTVHETLDSLIASTDVQTILRRVSGSENLVNLVGIISTTEALIAEQLAETHVDLLAGKEIVSPTIPGDNNEATISMVGSLKDLALDWSQGEYYGNGKILVPYTFSTEVYADSYIFKSDWYAMTDEESRGIGITDWNDHYYQAEAEYQVDVAGLLAIAVPVDLSARLYSREELENALQSVAATFDSIDSIKVPLDGWEQNESDDYPSSA